MPSDFGSQLVAYLRLSTALVAALGEDTSSPATVKIHGDVAGGNPDLPYLVLTEGEETSQYQGPDARGVAVHFDRGAITVEVHAAGKEQARAIGRLVSDQLSDAPIAPNDGTLLELRLGKAGFKPDGSLAPGTSTTACRTLEFPYVIQRP
jgi:hypothetical protein